MQISPSGMGNFLEEGKKTWGGMHACSRRECPVSHENMGMTSGNLLKHFRAKWSI